MQNKIHELDVMRNHIDVLWQGNTGNTWKALYNHTTINFFLQMMMI